MCSENILLIGLLFPAISLITTIGCIIAWYKHKKHCSPVFIPFIGPICLTIWIIGTSRAIWLIPIAWICDIGTLAFLYVTPRLIKDWWNTCSFTRVIKIHSLKANQTASISFHSTGRYLLHKEWKRSKGETGITSLGEVGVYTKIDNNFELISDDGWKRSLKLGHDGKLLVIEDEIVSREHQSYSIADWNFEIS